MRQKQLRRWHDRALNIVATAFIAGLNIVTEMFGSVFDPRIMDDQRSGWQVFKQVAEIITEEQWQIVFNTGWRNALSNIGIHTTGFRVLFEEVEPAGLKSADGRCI